MKQPIALGVNVNQVAIIREYRHSTYPDPVHAAFQAELHGADSISMQLRQDRQHIQEHDIERYAQSCQTRLNLQFEASESMCKFALQVKPGNVTLIPENREQLIDKGGLNIVENMALMSDYVSSLQQADIPTTLFINPDEAQIEAAARAGATTVELHTGRYAFAKTHAQRNAEIDRIISCSDYAFSLGMMVNAGHGLHFDNVQPIAEIDSITELTVGHSLISRAVYLGLPEVVSKMKRLMVEARFRC